ncbi:DUF1430 domain-containing protein [Cytobacillus sp. NCCP-133]|uniref:DUF1430 domain-containing protein n=1 Tax=Cytobacillus sp. NCCP-133 TaxID=766848 RepID=UPI0022305C37|nr:DUF1430 domain-containing protein [Cytobacillus sp. NCCP-133]GLB61479.1 hypothetical protein NCCP133_36080 [Cytobacillus sp. NCCP-133]
MKAIKYIISFCILLIGILIIGESHIFRLDNFYTEFDNTTLYIQPNITEEEMINDILDSANHSEVKVFTFIRSPRSTFYTEYDIYGTNGVEEYINDNLNIYDRKYTSLFLGQLNFTFNDIKSISGIDKIHDFYVIGNNEQVHQFKMELIDKYAGNHPQEGYFSNESKKNTMAIWILMNSIILVLSFYDIVLQKKESLIRVSMGERISKIIWRNILIDSIVFILLFSIILYMLSKFTNAFFMFEISLTSFIILLFANGLLYLNMYFYNLKEVFSNVKGSKKILSLNYSLKFITTITTILIISSNLALIFESYKFYKQKSFFEGFSDYYYTRLEYKPHLNIDGSMSNVLSDSAKVQATFYREFFEKYDATLLASTDGLLNGKGILANKNSFDYLSTEIKELKDHSLNKDIYFILPKRMSDGSISNTELNGAVKFYYGNNFSYDYDVIYYEDNVDIISIDENHMNGSKFVENPIIIYNNINAKEIGNQIESDSQKIGFVHEVMYKISNDGDFNQFVKEYDLTNQIVSKTNVLESYNNKWTNVKRVLYINFIFSILVLLLELIIISSIIKMEYEVNAIELSIKKVMGYSIFEKNRKIILITVITTMLSIVSSFIAAILINLEDPGYLVFGGIIILVLELLVIWFYIRKVENAKIQTILKGGNI